MPALNESAAKALYVLMHSGILLYPTDTIFGIGGDATDKKVVSKIYKIKKREKAKSLSVIMADLKMIKKYCLVSASQESILKKYLPGPFTFLLKLKKKLPASSNRKIGVRIPSSKSIVEFCKLLKKPIITTSANLSGKASATKLADVDKSIIEKVDLIIKGKVRHKQASTIVDLVENKVIRAGAGKFSFVT
ncbi:MAG: L-threonylcarbamoyladenylate synthase [Candidatus Micrarchaeota archaeon]